MNSSDHRLLAVVTKRLFLSAWALVGITYRVINRSWYKTRPASGCKDTVMTFLESGANMEAPDKERLALHLAQGSWLRTDKIRIWHWNAQIKVMVRKLEPRNE